MGFKHIGLLSIVRDRQTQTRSELRLPRCDGAVLSIPLCSVHTQASFSHFSLPPLLTNPCSFLHHNRFVDAQVNTPVVDKVEAEPVENEDEDLVEEEVEEGTVLRCLVIYVSPERGGRATAAPVRGSFPPVYGADVVGRKVERLLTTGTASHSRMSPSHGTDDAINMLVQVCFDPQRSTIQTQTLTACRREKPFVFRVCAQSTLVKYTLCHILILWAYLEPQWAVGKAHAESTLALKLAVEAVGAPGATPRLTRQSPGCEIPTVSPEDAAREKVSATARAIALHHLTLIGRSGGHLDTMGLGVEVSACTMPGGAPWPTGPLPPPLSSAFIRLLLSPLSFPFSVFSDRRINWCSHLEVRG